MAQKTTEQKLRQQLANEQATSAALRDRCADLEARLANAVLERSSLLGTAEPFRRPICPDQDLYIQERECLALLVEHFGLKGGPLVVENLRRAKMKLHEQRAVEVVLREQEVDRAALQRRIEEAVQSGLGDETEMEWQRTQAWLELKPDDIGWRDGEQVIPAGWPPNCDAEDRLREYFTSALTPKAPEPGDTDDGDPAAPSGPPASTDELLARLGGGR